MNFQNNGTWFYVDQLQKAHSETHKVNMVLKWLKLALAGELEQGDTINIQNKQNYSFQIIVFYTFPLICFQYFWLLRNLFT